MSHGSLMLLLLPYVVLLSATVCVSVGRSVRPSVTLVDQDQIG